MISCICNDIHGGLNDFNVESTCGYIQRVIIEVCEQWIATWFHCIQRNGGTYEIGDALFRAQLILNMIKCAVIVYSQMLVRYIIKDETFVDIVLEPY